MPTKVASQPVEFEAKLYTLKDWVILPVPKGESLKIGARGQISVTGTLNGHEFSTVLEPDGRWSHWMRVTNDMQGRAGVGSGDVVRVMITKSDIWPEPTVPKELSTALKTAPQKVQEKWKDITPMARWEWIRWMNATHSEDTKAVRLEKTISKLNGKHRRPCCFNLAACTEPYLMKSGRLMEVEQTK